MIQAVGATGAKGLIWAGTGNGSASADAQEALDALVRDGVVVVRATRTGSGCVAASGGMPGAGTLSPWKARVLLMLALGAGMGGVQDVFDTY